MNSKDLYKDDKIIFFLDGDLCDGTINERNEIGNQIDYIIQVEKGTLRMKASKLDLYFVCNKGNLTKEK